jgi:hypothetical protein
MKLRFVSSSRGNLFMTELLLAFADGAEELGADVTCGLDAFDDDPETIHVVVPHEYLETAPPAALPTVAQFRGTVALCVEHPGTQWFERSVAWAAEAGAVVDINRSSVAEARRRGVAAEHVQLGYVPAWDVWGGAATERRIDVAYLGSADARRARLLAGWAPMLARRRTALLVPPLAPKTSATADFVVGRAKHELLAGARVLLNLHRGHSRGLEWMRVLEAIANGCVVVTEHADDLAPLVPGEHVVSGAPESVGLLAEAVLEDSALEERLRRQAYEFVRDQLPLRPAVERLLELAEGLGTRPRATVTEEVLRLGSGPPAPPPEPAETWPSELQLLRSGLRSVLLGQAAALRRAQAGAAGPAVRVVAETPAFAGAQPRVTVIVSLFRYRDEVADALRSVAASQFEDFDVLVLDDASGDGSAEAVEEFLAAHPWLPARLLAHEANAGLGRVRNELARRARGELLFVLDADNGVFPTALDRLVAALDDDPDAAFAYPTIAVTAEGRPYGLLSAMAWEPARLRGGNYIDAMALVRRDALLALGGYAEEPVLTGYEDYDLWCRVAAAGGHGVHVPEILAWYRRAPHGLLAQADLDLATIAARVRHRAPALFYAD